MRNLGEKLFRIKDVSIATKDTTKQLSKSLHWWDLMFFGIGAIIGAGIFVLTGVAAKEAAGPSISVSFLIDALACILSGLCYCEFAAKVHLTGSAYTYTYAMIGELPAFYIGWALLLEYGFAVAAVARGWGGYLGAIVGGFGGSVPTYLSSIKFSVFDMDIIAGVAVVLVTGYLLFGIKSSSILNVIVTGLSVIIILFVVLYGATFVKPANWNNFAPNGFSGIFKGGGMVFFSYVGFDMVANFAEEAHNPKKDLPIGIIGSLLISSVLYVAVALVVTGMVPYYDLDIRAPLASAFGSYNANWAEIVISFGAFAALTTSMLVSLPSCARVLFSMSRDGLLPEFFALRSSNGEPYVSQLIAGGVFAVLTLLLNIEVLSELVSLGTLSAFTFVNACVIVLRTRGDHCRFSERPPVYLAIYVVMVVLLALVSRFLTNLPWITVIFLILLVIPGGLMFHHFYRYVFDPRETDSSSGEHRELFKTPLVPLVPLTGILVNVYLMCSLAAITWIAFAVWLMIGSLIYVFYGYRHSVEGARIKESEPLFRV